MKRFRIYFLIPLLVVYRASESKKKKKMSVFASLKAMVS